MIFDTFLSESLPCFRIPLFPNSKVQLFAQINMEDGGRRLSLGKSLTQKKVLPQKLTTRRMSWLFCRRSLFRQKYLFGQLVFIHEVAMRPIVHWEHRFWFFGTTWPLLSRSRLWIARDHNCLLRSGPIQLNPLPEWGIKGSVFLKGNIFLEMITGEPEKGVSEPNFHLPLHRIVQSCICQPVTHPKVLQLFRNLRRFEVQKCHLRCR